MKIFADYHTHTTYSHGSGSIEDNVKIAYEKGLKVIGICDHGPGHYLYGVKREKIKEMREEVDRLNSIYNEKGLKILLGVEANIVGFDGTIDVDDEILKDLDILLLGYHYGVTPNSFTDFIKFYILNPIAKILPIGRKASIQRNTDAFIRAINRYPVDLITHPGAKVKVDINRLGKEVKRLKIPLEINAKHGELSVESLEIANKLGVDFIISSDAHCPESVGNVEKSILRAQIAKIDKSRVKNIERREV